MNAKISETIRATILALGMQIAEIAAQRKFVYAKMPRPPKPVAATLFMLDKKF